MKDRIILIVIFVFTLFNLSCKKSLKSEELNSGNEQSEGYSTVQESGAEPSGYKYNSRDIGSNGDYSYNYDVSGTDEGGNSVSGNIDIEGKYGNGTLTDECGNEKSIDVEWVDKGQLVGTDEDGHTYDLGVE